MLRPRAMPATSSSSQARTEPPSASRAAEARAHGHAPRAELASLAAAFLALVWLFARFSELLVRSLQTLLTEPLRRLSQGMAVALEPQGFAALSLFGPMLAAGLALCFVCMLLARSVAQGGVRFSLRALSPRKHFDKVGSTRWLSALLACVMCSVLIGITLPAALRVQPIDLQEMLTRVAFRLAAALVLLALIDAALARAAWWRSLWMTRRERSAEEREAYGSPELRARRERIRREPHAAVDTQHDTQAGTQADTVIHTATVTATDTTPSARSSS